MKNEFDLPKDEPVGGAHFHINGFTKNHFDTETKDNSKMAYSPYHLEGWSMKMILTYCYILLTFMESLG